MSEILTETTGKTLTLRLQIEVRTRREIREEVWTCQHTMKKVELTEADFVPFILQKEVDGPFGTSIKRESFRVESLDTEKNIVTFKRESFARSSWFYQNIQNFGFEPERVKP